MYIVDCNDQLTPLSSSPRAMTVELQTPDCQSSLKRKRGNDADDSNSFHILSSPNFGQVPLPTPAPSFSSSFYDTPSPFDPSRLTHPLQRNKSHDSRNSKRLQLSPKPRLSRHVSQPSSDLSSFASLASPSTTACHVCQRRPSTRQDLPGYVDCEVCGMRTCFVCIRTCEGTHCQTSTVQRYAELGVTEEELPTGKRICSSCCVEIGSEGMIWCLACYNDDTGLDAYSTRRTKEELEAESTNRVADWLTRTDSAEASDGMSLHDHYTDFLQ